MAIDPRNYDLAELRGAPSPIREAGGTSPDRETGTSTSPAAAAFERAVARDLVTLDAEIDDLRRPYLDALPASLAAEALILEWLEFLALRTGRESVTDALSFYASVGWVSEDVATDLEPYLAGIEDDRRGDDLGADDHRVSLAYVARLASL
jgi:archaellum component FlaD/FlaE